MSKGESEQKGIQLARSFQERGHSRWWQQTWYKRGEVLNESILRSSSCSGFNSALCEPSLAARATSCRRIVTNFWCTGTSSGDRTDKDSCSCFTMASKAEGNGIRRYIREWNENIPHSLSCRSRSLVNAFGCFESCCTICLSSFSRRWKGARSASLYAADSLMWLRICWQVEKEIAWVQHN